MTATRHWDWDDSDGERAIPRVTRTRNSENSLYPVPPAGWLKVYSYTTAPPVDPRDAAAWIACVATVQTCERKSKTVRQSHMISRQPDGNRVLIVHPNLADEVDNAVETINAILVDCTCGGYDCLEHTLQHRAAKVFLRRALNLVDPAFLPEILTREEIPPEIVHWADLSIPQRMKLVRNERLDPSKVLEDLHWIDVIQANTCILEAIATELYEIVGVPRPWALHSEEASLIDQEP